MPTVIEFAGVPKNFLMFEKIMKCVICKTGHTHSGTTTVTLQNANAVVVIRDVLAKVCENCDPALKFPKNNSTPVPEVQG